MSEDATLHVIIPDRNQIEKAKILDIIHKGIAQENAERVSLAVAESGLAEEDFFKDEVLSKTYTSNIATEDYRLGQFSGSTSYCISFSAGKEYKKGSPTRRNLLVYIPENQAYISASISARWGKGSDIIFALANAVAAEGYAVHYCLNDCTMPDVYLNYSIEAWEGVL
jgi:hypothetical protein